MCSFTTTEFGDFPARPRLIFRKKNIGKLSHKGRLFCNLMKIYHWYNKWSWYIYIYISIIIVIYIYIYIKGFDITTHQLIKYIVQHIYIYVTHVYRVFPLFLLNPFLFCFSPFLPCPWSPFSLTPSSPSSLDRTVSETGMKKLKEDGISPLDVTKTWKLGRPCGMGRMGPPQWWCLLICWLTPSI